MVLGLVSGRGVPGFYKRPPCETTGQCFLLAPVAGACLGVELALFERQSTFGWGILLVISNISMAVKEVAFDPVLKALGRVVQQRRTMMSISQEELARRARLHRTYVSDVERGSRSVSLITLCKLAEALETTASTLVMSAEKGSASGDIR